MTLEDAIEVPEKVQPFFEKHKADKVLRIRRLRSDASRKKVDKLVIDLHRELCCKDVLIGTVVYYDREHDSLIYL